MDCHIPVDQIQFPIPPDWLAEEVCKSCHIEAGIATEVDNHVSPNYGDTLYCQNCHNPHRHQEIYPRYYIREKIKTTGRGKIPVSFRDSTDFVHGEQGGAVPFDGICETCHTQTTHHRFDGSAPAQDHYSANDCTSCHPHEDGFRPTRGNCLECHSVAQPEGAGEYRRVIADTLGNVGDFARASRHNQGQVREEDCLVCHYMGLHQSIPDPQVILKNVDTGDTIRYTGAPESVESFCLACHDENGAGGDPAPFTDDVVASDISTFWESAAHNTGGNTNQGYTCMGDGLTTGCHGNGHGSMKKNLLTPDDESATEPLFAEEEEGFCYNCHDGNPVVNDAISGAGLTDNIQSAFGMGNRHPVRDNEGAHTFTLNNNEFELECTTCHNPHVVTGRYWDAEQGLTPITRPDFTDPVNNSVGMGTVLWGDDVVEKADNFAVNAAGTGGWYYNVARGYPYNSTNMAFNRPAVYQPPRTDAGYVFEFDGDELPDYTTFCLDCHSYTMSDAVYPINWGQGIPTNYNGNPNTWVTARSPHGLNSANRPYFWGDVGLFGASGNPDPIFNQNGVTRGRGAGHFMRWPYESADKNSGINFVLSCTDCHETHGSNIGSMLRTNPNNGVGSTIWNTMCNNCHYYYGGQHAGMSCGNASCHEVNSIHRIKKNGEYSGATYLWEPPGRPDVTPEIESVVGYLDSDEVTINFTAQVWANPDQSGSLTPVGFVFTDINGDNARSITEVSHQGGDQTAIVTFSQPVIFEDAYTDILASAGISAWDADGDPAGPYPLTLTICPPEAVFNLSEAAGSNTAADSTGLLTGTVSNPDSAFRGDGYFHGDENDVTHIVFDNNLKSLLSTRQLTIEARIMPSEVNLDYGDTTRNITSQTIWFRYRSIVLRVMRADFAGDGPDSTHRARLMSKYRPIDRHGGAAWKQVSTDKDAFPITRNHWYLIKLVFNSDKIGNIEGTTGVPIDIFIDDQGTDGEGADENWQGYRNASHADPLDSAGGNEYYASFAGDEITPVDGEFNIGANTRNFNFKFNGLIDWVRWRPTADYGGVDDSPN